MIAESVITLALALAPPRVNPTRSPDEARDAAKAQNEFGILVAKKELWNEAIFRWKRAIEIDRTYAAAYNNLAVAYEQRGMLDEAESLYEKALSLDPGNELIEHNLRQFEWLDAQRLRIRGGR
jgi:Flp pilus assembly protein TadD